jgi:hypothetical protein
VQSRNLGFRCPRLNVNGESYSVFARRHSETAHNIPTTAP